MMDSLIQAMQPPFTFTCKYLKTIQLFKTSLAFLGDIIRCGNLDVLSIKYLESRDTVWELLVKIPALARPSGGLLYPPVSADD